MTERERKHGRGHEDRDDLTGEHAWNDGGQIVLMVVFFIVWGIDSFYLRLFAPFDTFWFLLATIPASIAIMVPAALLANSAHEIVFGEVREVPGVIRKGVFGVVRHPMYAGSLLVYAAFLVMTLSVLASFVAMVAVVFYYAVARCEERLLTERFGEDYERYRRDVPMMVPRL